MAFVLFIDKTYYGCSQIRGHLSIIMYMILENLAWKINIWLDYVNDVETEILKSYLNFWEKFIKLFETIDN